MSQPLLIIVLSGSFLGAIALPQAGYTSDRPGAIPGPTATATPSVPQVSVEAGEADGTAQIAATLGDQWTLKLSTPVREGTDRDDFASLDGLADTLNLALGFSAVVHEPSPLAVDRARKAVCKNLCVPDEKCGEADDVKAYLTEHGTKVSERFARQLALAGFHGAWLAYSEGKVGTDKREFFTNNGEKGKRRPTAWSGSLALVRDGGSNRFLIGVTRERAIEDSETEVEKCQPVDGSALPTCKTLPLGPPSESYSTLARVSWTYLVATHPLGFSPTASYSFSKKETGIEVPIFFLSDSDDHLTGGVRLAWTSKSNDFKASVFVTKPISLFN